MEEKYRILLYKTTDNLIRYLSACFSSNEIMEFYSLLNCDKSDMYKFEVKFTEQLIPHLCYLWLCIAEKGTICSSWLRRLQRSTSL
jgi:hypothetical protein